MEMAMAMEYQSEREPSGPKTRFGKPNGIGIMVLFKKGQAC
jgi:hypothetical protein